MKKGKKRTKRPREQRRSHLIKRSSEARAAMVSRAKKMGRVRGGQLRGKEPQEEWEGVRGGGGINTVVSPSPPPPSPLPSVTCSHASGTPRY